MARFGWRPFFIVLGAASLAWLIPWLKWMPRGPGIVTAHAAHPPPGVLHILGQRSAWGSFGGLFCGNYYWYFLLTWLPSYMVKERNFSKDHMANMSALAFLAIGVSSAPPRPSTRSKIHFNTRTLSPNPGHRNFPSSPLRNQFT